MATAPRTSRANPSATVVWPNDSTTFDGWLLIGIVPPVVTVSGGSSPIDAPHVAYGNQIILEKLPTFYVTPIIEGKYDQNCRVFYSSDLEPSGVTYVAWLFDRTWRAVDSPTISDAFTVTSETFSPTLNLLGISGVPGATIPTINS